MRSVPCRMHVVFYVKVGGVIGIVRVLHARQNAPAWRWEEKGVTVDASTH